MGTLNNGTHSIAASFQCRVRFSHFLAGQCFKERERILSIRGSHRVDRCGMFEYTLRKHYSPELVPEQAEWPSDLCDCEKFKTSIHSKFIQMKSF